MPRHNTSFANALKKAQRKGRLIPELPAAVAWRNPPPVEIPAGPEPAEMAAPAPALHEPSPVVWPRNESEIDLPDEPPPVLHDGPPPCRHVGTIRAISPHHAEPFDLDVVLLSENSISLFGWRLDIQQALALSRLLLRAVQSIQRQEVTA